MNAEGILVEKLFDRSVMSSFHGFWSVGVLVGSAVSALASHAGVDTRIQFAVEALVLRCGRRRNRAAANRGPGGHRRACAARLRAPDPARPGDRARRPLRRLRRAGRDRLVGVLYPQRARRVAERRIARGLCIRRGDGDGQTHGRPCDPQAGACPYRPSLRNVRVRRRHRGCAGARSRRRAPWLRATRDRRRRRRPARVRGRRPRGRPFPRAALPASRASPTRVASSHRGSSAASRRRRRSRRRSALSPLWWASLRWGQVCFARGNSPSRRASPSDSRHLTGPGQRCSLTSSFGACAR